MGISIAALEIRWCEVTLERIGSHPVDILDMKDEVAVAGTVHVAVEELNRSKGRFTLQT